MKSVPSTGFTRSLTVLALIAGLIPAPAFAAVPPEGGSPAQALAFEHPTLYLDDAVVAPSALAGLTLSRARGDLARLGVSEDLAYYNPRSARPATLMLARPMIPGTGKGNSLGWKGGASGPASLSDEEIGQAAWVAFREFLVANQAELGIDPAELGTQPQISVFEEGAVIQTVVDRKVDGISVRGSTVSAVINHGNLILYGTSRWGDVEVVTAPTLTVEEARAAIEAYVAGVPLDSTVGELRLVILPVSAGGEERPVGNPEFASAMLGSALGGGAVQGAAEPPARATDSPSYAHRLAWAADVSFDGELGGWEILLDGHDAEVLAFADQNQYIDRQIRGGVYPLTNDQVGPEGTEQAGWPMPFVNANTARTVFSNSNGLLPATFTGNITTTLDGQFIRILDNCGTINQTTALPSLDLGASGGTDCVRPAGAPATGTTHSARTGFYELNRLKEQWRGWNATNTWLQARLTSNMDINNTCNAFWTGSGTGGTVNFYRSGGGCANTGEIAAVFDHEAGHGFDANDGRTGTSNSSESYGDIVGMLRLNTSCIGRGFRLNDVQCGGNGDACLECSGVRQEDWTKRRSGLPHNVEWIQQFNNDPGLQDANGNWLRWPGGCRIPPGGTPTSGGPCNRGTHCEGSVSAEAFWDLMHRDLAGQYGSPFNWDENRRLNFSARLGLLGMNTVATWFSCTPTTPGFHGCAATGAYMLFLATDDDNGNLADGTPHMTAIFNAHNRHQLACATPAVQNSGCAAIPTAAPTVTVTPQKNGAAISWTTVPGATKYWLFKADGVDGCLAGKQRIVNANVTSFVDTTLVNGREFYYTVMAVGGSDTCSGPASPCAAVVPRSFPVAAGGSVTTDEDTAVTVTLSASDEDSPSLTFSILAGPAHGTLGAVSAPACAPQGEGFACTATVTYTPAADYFGADSFTFKASDDSLDSNTAAVSITVNPVNDAPVVGNLSVEAMWNTSTPIALGAADVDSASLSLAIVSGPAHGTVSLGAVSCAPSAGGAVCSATAVYTPAAGFTGADSFTYRANDGSLDSNLGTVAIRVFRLGKITGSGTIDPAGDGGTGSFAISVNQRPGGGANGNLTYTNAARGLTVQSVAITSMSISGVTGTFAGTCTKNGVPCTFSVYVEDNGEPPFGDRFVIAVSGEPAEGGSGPLTGGNIQVHKP